MIPVFSASSTAYNLIEIGIILDALIGFKLPGLILFPKDSIIVIIKIFL